MGRGEVTGWQTTCSAAEEAALDAQAAAEARRDQADQVRLKGDEQIAEAKVVASAMITVADARYDDALTAFEKIPSCTEAESLN